MPEELTKPKRAGRPRMDTVKVCVSLPRDLIEKFKKLGGSAFVRRSVLQAIENEKGKDAEFRQIAEKLDGREAKAILLELLKRAS